MTTLFFLARHARHAGFGERLLGRTPGVSLDEEGREQARRLGEKLRWIRPVAVVTSPRERTRETGEIVAQALGLSATTDAGLDEIDVGDWTGRTFEELAGDQPWRRWNEDREGSRAPGGETMGEAQDRALAAIDRLAQRHPDSAVVLVSHADVIKSVMLAELGLPLNLYSKLKLEPTEFALVSRESEAAAAEQGTLR